MKHWYRMTDDIHFPGRWQLRNPVLVSTGQEVDPWAFTKGEHYSGATGFRSDHDPGVTLDFTLGGISVPFASSGLAGLLRLVAHEAVQVLPVDVDGHPFFVVNATRTVACIDEGRSVFTKWAEADGRPDKVGRYRMVARLVVDARKLEGQSIVRIKDWNVALLVAEEVKEAIEAGGFTGPVFEPVT